MEYHFYGWKNASVPAVSSKYPGIFTPLDLYRALSSVWCAETCAPRMRADWSPDNPTLGQCSITAFLAQDIFGGKVYGIPLNDGCFHCYNAVRDCVFDLTSEQFGDCQLNYTNNPEQFRKVHFAKYEKHQRYEMLKKLLTRHLSRIEAVSSIPFSAEKKSIEWADAIPDEDERPSPYEPSYHDGSVKNECWNDREVY